MSMNYVNSNTLLLSENNEHNVVGVERKVAVAKIPFFTIRLGIIQSIYSEHIGSLHKMGYKSRISTT